MILKDAELLALQLMKQYNLLSDNWTFKFDRASRRFGLCRHKTKTIQLSSKLVELNSKYHVSQTILHEIAHALVGLKHGHDKVWKQKAISIGDTGDRCYSYDVIQPDIKHKKLYIIKCNNCGYNYRKHRKTNAACGKCCKLYNNSKYSDLYKLECIEIKN